ncbi:MAG: hypothetical protein ACYDIA_13820 [Candidatus Humimicrobiaceae bacterium]
MSAGKFMIIIIICSLLIIAGVMWLTIYDTRTAKEAIAVKEHRELKSIPDDINEARIKELIREADLSAFKLEQHRLELEKMLEGKN